MAINKKNVYLHIGLPKTGTTALQSALNVLNNQGLLEQHDYNFLHDTTWPIIAAFWNTKCEHEFISSLTNQLNSITQSNIILSNEAFSVDRQYQLDTLSSIFINPLFKCLESHNTKVIVYLRRQDILLESLSVQLVKLGLVGRKSLFRKDMNLYYKEFLDTIAKLFGKENLIVCHYDRKELYKNDIISDFLEKVGLGHLYIDEIDNLSMNKSLNPEALRCVLPLVEKYVLTKDEVKFRLEQLGIKLSQGKMSVEEYNHVGSRLSMGIDIRDNPYRWRYVPLLLLNDSSIHGNVGYLSEDERKTIWEQYAEDNAAVAREYFGREDGILFNTKMPKRIEKITDPSTSDIVCTFMPIFGNLDERVEHLTHSRDKHSTTLEQLTSQLNHLNRIILQQEEMITSLQARLQAIVVSSQRRVLYVKKPWKYIPVIIHKVCHRLAIQAKFPKCYALLHKIYHKFDFWK